MTLLRVVPGVRPECDAETRCDGDNPVSLSSLESGFGALGAPSSVACNCEPNGSETSALAATRA